MVKSELVLAVTGSARHAVDRRWENRAPTRATAREAIEFEQTDGGLDAALDGAETVHRHDDGWLVSGAVHQLAEVHQDADELERVAEMRDRALGTDGLGVV